MKYFLIVFTFITLIGCTSKSSHIFGSWKSPAKQLSPITLVYDSMVFLRPDSLKSFLFRNGSLVRTAYGTFTADEMQKKLTINLPDSTYQFNILSLTNDSLVFRHIEDTVINTYLKATNDAN